MGSFREEARVEEAVGDGAAADVSATAATFSRLTTLFPRLLVLVLSTLALAVLVTSRQRRQIAGFDIKAHWYDAKAFISLAALNAVCAGYSLVQAIVCLATMKKILWRYRSFAWLTCASDQLLAYALVSCASASAEVAFIAKHGQQSSGWSEVCSTFRGFCNKAGIGLILSFLSFLALAASAVMACFNATVVYSFNTRISRIEVGQGKP